MLKLKFPHIPRKITAPLVWYTEKIGLWSTLAALVLINFYARANLTPAYWDKLVRTLQTPYLVQPHLDLAQAFWQNDLATAAEAELVFASSLSPGNPAILGSQTNPLSLLREWRNTPSKVASHYRFWQVVISQKPDYRDAYLTLSALGWQQSRWGPARVYLNQALSLDPNSPLGHELSLLLGE